MDKILPLVEAKSPILRNKTRPLSIEEIEQWQNTAKNMIVTMYEKNGIGLAAPQVGIPIQLFVAKSASEPNKKWIFFNPEITHYGRQTSTEIEGCLSLPNVFVPVERPKKIVVKYHDDSGKIKKATFEGTMARVYQHEFDHLEGIMIIDRTNEEEKKRLAPFLEKEFGIFSI